MKTFAAFCQSVRSLFGATDPWPVVRSARAGQVWNYRSAEQLESRLVMHGGSLANLVDCVNDCVNDCCSADSANSAAAASTTGAVAKAHGNDAMTAEHRAVFGSRDATTGAIAGGLVPDAAVTYKSAGSGDWLNSSTWLHVNNTGEFLADGTRPGAGDNVLISSGTIVLVDGNVAVDGDGGRVALRTIRVDGMLKFDPTHDTRLLVDTVVVEPTGVLEIGTDDAPIATKQRAQLIFADRELGLTPDEQREFEEAQREWDSLQFSHGLLSHGDVEIHGTHVTSFISINGGISAGSSSFPVSSLPEGWRAGDYLIITGSTAANARGDNQDEQVTIAGLDGTSVLLSTPLKYDHRAGMTFVADLTRNVSLQSENPGELEHRGHVMFMHSDDVHIVGAGFYGLGRTNKRMLIDDPVLRDDPDNPGHKTTDVITDEINSEHPELGHRVLVPKVDVDGNPLLNPDGTPRLQIARTGMNPRGRYAVHFHRTGVDGISEPAVLSDCVVSGSPGWGVVNHSSNVDVTDNVVFNATGAAFVTEAGDELGSFDHNIAIHSRGSGEVVMGRERIQDFGHQGDGFWFQGGNVSVTNNVASGQRQSGFAFFPRGLDQSGVGLTTISGANLSHFRWAKRKLTYDVADVPLKEFRGNSSFGVKTGFETWFSLENAKCKGRTVVEDFTVQAATGTAIFTPYTSNITFKHVTAIGDLDNPTGIGFKQNFRTRNVVYDHVTAEGFEVGIVAPINGKNAVIGGRFNNLRNIEIGTANKRGRTMSIDDASPNDPIQFVDNLTRTVGDHRESRPQCDVFLTTSYDPQNQDLTKLFQPDVSQVTRNGQQLYYLEQVADFVPFDSNNPEGVPTWVPANLRDKTNQQLQTEFGLAIGGSMAPRDGVRDPNINAILGPPATYPARMDLMSAKYTNSLSDYRLHFSYIDPATNATMFVSEHSPRQLVSGWNVLTRTVLGQPRSLMVYGDVQAPTFQFNPGLPTTLNLADLQRGTTLVIDNYIHDDSFGAKRTAVSIKLNDPQQVSELQTRADRTRFVTLTFSIQDFAGNSSQVKFDLGVTSTARLIKDLNPQNMPFFDPRPSAI